MIQNVANPIKATGRKTLLFLSLIVFILSMLFPQNVLAEPIPSKPSTNIYVFDYADLIDSQDEQEMRKIAKSIDDKTKAQIVVVTVNDLSQMEIEEYSLNLFRNWGIGDREKNNGVLILVNKESLIANRRGRIRIEVGYGLEGAITDGKAGAILDNYALPAFEEGEYSKGIKDTFMAVSAEVAKEYDLDLENNELSVLEDYSDEDYSALLIGLIIAIFVIICIIILLNMIGRGRSRHYWGGPFGPFGSGGFSGGFGNFGGGGFSGGSFGGGRSGGGGASR